MRIILNNFSLKKYIYKIIILKKKKKVQNNLTNII